MASSTILLYSPEITEEIFDKVVSKLESLGYKRDCGNSNSYGGFKFHGGLGWWPNTWMTVARNRDRKVSWETYITWQEILSIGVTAFFPINKPFIVPVIHI